MAVTILAPRSEHILGWCLQDISQTRGMWQDLIFVNVAAGHEVSRQIAIETRVLGQGFQKA